MIAGGFAAGSAMCEMVDVPRHDTRTRRTLDGFRQRLHDGTDQAVLLAAVAVDGLVHPLADELRDIVDTELSRRDLSLALLAGGAR